MSPGFDLFPGTDPNLKDALRIRSEVFVQEQGVPLELEIDDYDGIAWHVLAYEGNVPVATARLVSVDACRIQIGRMATLVEFRRRGIAAQLLDLMLEYARREGFEEVILDSSLEAMPLYERRGFKATGAPFLDAGIIRRRMTRKLPTSTR